MCRQTKRALACFVAIAVLAGRTVSAQTVTDSPASSAATEPGLKISLMVWVGGVAADQITTYQFASHHRDVLHESNPLIRGLDRHPALLVAAGSAIDAASGWAAYRVLGPRHPRLAKAMFYGAAAFRTYLAVSNRRLMQQLQGVRSTAPSPTSIPQ